MSTVSGNVQVMGRVGPDGPGVLVLYTGGTIGMIAGPDGSLVPLDLRQLRAYVPIVQELPIGLTVATFVEPIDSAAIAPRNWLDIADALVEHSPGHVGIVVLHGTDTMAYTASALSFLLDGIAMPVVLTGAQRPITSLRSDGRENLVTALQVAAGRSEGAPPVPEVTIFFNDVLLRGNRAVKVHADSYRGFASPNFPPLATAGVTLDYAPNLLRTPNKARCAALLRCAPTSRPPTCIRPSTRAPSRRSCPGRGCGGSCCRRTAPATGRRTAGSSTACAGRSTAVSPSS